MYTSCFIAKGGFGKVCYGHVFPKLLAISARSLMSTLLSWFTSVILPSGTRYNYAIEDFSLTVYLTVKSYNLERGNC